MAEITTTTDVSTTTKEWVLEEIEENDHLAPTSSATDTASSEEDDDSSSTSVEVKEQEPEQEPEQEQEQEQEQEKEQEQEQPQSSEQPPKDNQEAEQEVIVLTEDNQLTYEENSDVVEIAETRMSTQAIVEDSETVTKSLEVQQSNTATASHETSESSNQNEEIKAKEEAEEGTGVEGDDDEAEGAALDRRMTYIGEGLLDVGGMDAIDRLSDLSAYSDLESMTAAEDQKSAADVSSRHMSIDENYEFNLETQSPEGAKTSEAAASTSDESHSSQTTSAPPATPNKLLAFLAKGSEQKLASVNFPPPAATVVAAPKSTPAVLRPLPPPPSPQAPMAAPVKPQLPTVSIENRRSKLLDFLANDVGERYLDGVYQEETRDDQGDTTTDDEQDYNSEDGGMKKSEDEQEQSRQRRVKRANSKLLAFLAKERGERLHRVERGSEDASAQRNSISSETSSTSADGEHHHQHQHAQPKSTSKLLDFVSKVVPDKPKFVIFDPADAVSETEELEHLVAEEAQKKKMKRENREKARQKVLGLLAKENTHTVAASGASHSKHQASSTVKSVDETKVQREKVTDRYGREGLLDFLDRTEAAQQRKIRWATSRNSSSSGSSSPSSSTTSSPKSSLLPPPPGTPTATSPASSRSQPVRTIAAPPAVVPPPSPPPPPPAPRSAPHATNRLASFLSKITSKASYSPQVPPRHESPAPAAPKQIAKSPITVPAPPAASVRDEAPLTSPASSPMTSPARSVDSVEAAATPVKADDAIATLSKSSTQKVQPVLTALSQISQTCASHELNDVAIARITTLLNSISQIVKEDVQKRSRGEPVRRWSNASSSSPSWVKSGKEIEEFDKKHASVMTFSHATATASTLEISSNPAVLERSSEPKVTVATSVLQSFNDFESAQNLLEIVAAFHKLLTDCGLTDLKLAQPWAVYDHVKSAVASKLGFRQKQLFKLLDAKFNGDVYNKKPAARKRVCIIGAGPVGLRAAVEMALLGAQVVVLEKRKHFSRENILHLWPWVVQDLTSLGAKVLFPQFCHSTAYFHVGTRQLQCILLKVALLLGVTFFPATTFEGIAHPDSLDSGRRPFYTIVTKPQVPWMEFTAVLGACGTQDRLSDQARIKRFVFSRKEAIGLVCYFPNHGTTEEKNVAEFSWTIQFKQQMFAKMREVGVDLENIVYYRGEMHYLVMTPKRQNLLDQGVLKLDYPNVSDLVLDDNIDKLVLHDYLKRVVDFVKIPQKAEFSRVRIFDFSSRTRADKAASILTSKGKKLYVGLIGDSLMEPFWPEGLGTCRGFLSALDGCWMVAQVGFSSDEQLLADRELAYRVIQHVSGFRRDDLQKNVRKYSVDPKTRYVVKFPQLC